MRASTYAPGIALWFCFCGVLTAAEPPLELNSISFSNQSVRLDWEPYPAADQYGIRSAGSIGGSFTNNLSGLFSGPSWTSPQDGPTLFYRLSATPMSADAILTANVLNRLAYGPTPDELERVSAIGPQAYIDEQLAAELIDEDLDVSITVTTNNVPFDPSTNWVNVVVTGRATSSRLYMYLTTAGEVYIDDITLVAGTNANAGPNLIQNGGFESTFPGPWNVSANHGGSTVSTSPRHSGNASLRVVASSGGTTQGSSIWQNTLPLTNGEFYTLSYWVLPNSHSSKLILRLSGSGIISSAPGESEPPTWVYITETGPASSRTLYIYLSGADDAYLDDIKLVAGTEPEVGPNLILNGDFESAFPGPWNVSPVLSNSYVSTAVAFSGSASLHLISTGGGSSRGTSIYQENLSLTQGQIHTLSYWYRPATRGRDLTVRLSGSGIRSEPDDSPAGVKRQLDDAVGSITDLRAWFCLSAVRSKRQLLEVLSQFIENHFVTQYSKSRDYFDNRALLDTAVATEMEYREMSRWRQALLGPNCTFYELLKISAESPAQIIYLDTVDSKGNGNNIANENYARELVELYTFGVDNGYDQTDIVEISKTWTGWSVQVVDKENKDNPFAPQSSTYYPGVSSTSTSNRVGVWAFNYRQQNHDNNPKYIFFNRDADGAILSSKTVPARFGSPWASRAYSLVVNNGSGTNGIQDGYQVIRHVADQPFTQEYISVKLCRWFVHDDFAHGYDFTDPNLSPEGQLVKQCMLAWENGNPRGQIRHVLRVIFDSELFRTHAGSMQKVKTPIEFVASAVRALRSANSDGTFTAETDGYSFDTPLNRMGAMRLFDRADPDGYPEGAAGWVSAGTLAERIRFVQSFLIASGQSGRGDAGNNVCDPVTLLKSRLFSGSWNDAVAVADYFVNVLFPGEGRANLDQYRQLAVDFLNRDDSGMFFSSFSSLAHTSTAYDTRVRGMVAMLLTLPRFQEQ